MQTLTIVKIGGNVIDKPNLLQSFLNNFAHIAGNKILLHGGGVMASEMLGKLNIPVIMHEGRRITDCETLKICAMVYAGWINKNIVAQLQAVSCNAMGLSGADINCISASRRLSTPIDYGYVGDVLPFNVNTSGLAELLSIGITPVLCAITHDKQGGLLNTNADNIASAVAIALSGIYAVKLIFCFEKQGVLLNPDDENSVMANILPDDFQQMKDKCVISKGMLPKLENAFAALRAGVSEVYIKHADNLLTGKGTSINLKNNMIL